MDLEKRIETLARWMAEARRIVVFTGAGISTESGLPDFRGPDGIWTRREKGLPPRPMEMDWSEVEPNEGHRAIRALQDMGKLDFLITQNVDNLHIKSGIKPELLAELHGNITRLRCERCERQYPANRGGVSGSMTMERCECSGKLRSSVVNFGEPLPYKDLMDSYDHSRRSDLFIVVGSSLVVTPAADMPRIALEAGAKVVIINQGNTPLDHLVHLRFHEKAGDVLPRCVKRLREIISM